MVLYVTEEIRRDFVAAYVTNVLRELSGCGSSPKAPDEARNVNGAINMECGVKARIFQMLLSADVVHETTDDDGMALNRRAEQGRTRHR